MRRDALPVSVRHADDSDSADWSRYLASRPEATIFHRWVWREILQKSFGHRPHWLIAERAGDIVGILPLAEVRTQLFGHRLVSLPFCSWCGPVADDTQALDQLDRHAIALGCDLGATHVEYRQQTASFARPTQDLYAMFTLPITADDAANLAAIPRKQRAMVRKAIGRGLTSEPCGLAQFYELYADNVHRHGTPACSRRFFDCLSTSFGDDCQLMLVRDPAGWPLSAVLSLYHGDEVLPFYAGDRPAARDLAANDFKYWALMRQAAAYGVRRFNFGRSKRGTGSWAFKKHWGCTETPLHYQFWSRDGVGIPELNPLNPRYRLAIELWRRLPRAAVDLAGPWIVRGLG